MYDGVAHQKLGRSTGSVDCEQCEPCELVGLLFFSDKSISPNENIDKLSRPTTPSKNVSGGNGGNGGMIHHTESNAMIYDH